jgi:hypothetical protein
MLRHLGDAAWDGRQDAPPLVGGHAQDGLVDLAGSAGSLGEQLIGGIRIRPVLPDLGHLAVTDLKDQNAVVLQRPAATLGRDLVQTHPVLVVGHDIVDLDPEAPTGQLHGPAEVAQDGVDALVVAGQLVAAGGVPDDLGIEQRSQGVHVAAAEGVVAPPDEVLVGMAHHRPLVPAQSDASNPSKQHSEPQD